jgi:hypothetical protein
MADPQPPPQSEKTFPRLWLLVLGFIVFGAMMAARTEITVAWARALVAGVAFATLCLAVEAARKPKG